ncbi:exopolysaccharide biosynthesis polyprenyl glycosylphosphotransferase [Cetobacterium sp.]|uniref:exopolysaccharide biosynthesis polyprenyl glycosylphosphotransferase n=1 Tax=Cetobacterium sp. TaxID=2071632 RepID=UPI003F3EBD06
MRNSYKRYVVGSFMVLSQFILFWQTAMLLGTDREVSVVAYLIFVFLYLKENIYSFETCLIWEELKKQMKCLAEYIVLTGIVVLVFLGPKELLRYELLGILSFVYSFLIAKMIRLAFYGFLKKNLVIVGVGEMANELKTVVGQNRFTMYNLIGFLDLGIDKYKIDKADIIGYDVCGVLKTNRVDELIVATPNMNDSELHDFIDLVVDKVNKIKIIPDVNRIFTVSPEVQNYDTIMMIGSKNYVTSRKRQMVKRAIDIAAGIAGCIVLIPLTILVWFKTEKEEREKGIFFTQNRIGANGETIKIYKYRSMVTGADEILKKLLAEDPEKCEEYRKNKKLKDDPRITKIGEFLRRTSLDEFPQFFNVIKGEMSFVGPRPYLFDEVEDMGKAYDKIVNLKPGITGMWQAHGRSDTDFEERLVLDEYYYRNWTLWLDAIIVIKTIKNVVAKEGAY